MRFSIERSVGRRMKHTYYGDVPFLEEDGVVGLDQVSIRPDSIQPGSHTGIVQINKKRNQSLRASPRVVAAGGNCVDSSIVAGEVVVGGDAVP